MTDPKLAQFAQSAGADALGVVLATSPREVTEAVAKSIVASVDVDVYLLTVDREAGEVLELAERLGVAGIQPYGAHASGAARAASAAGLAVLRPIAVSDQPPDLSGVPEDQMVLTDTAGAFHGGSGVSFDWDLVRNLTRPFVLAGGLNPETVRRAINLSGATGVDVSSGVEAAPGRKDPLRIRAFIERANHDET